MKHFIYIAVLIALVLAVASPSEAMISVGTLSKERAKKLGIELRAKPNGQREAWLELELKPEGELKNFMHVSLEVADGDQFLLGWTPLKDDRQPTGSVIVRVMGNRVFLEKVTLRIVAGATGEVGHDLPVKDFVDFKKLS
jgi:hypothetical protein